MDSAFTYLPSDAPLRSTLDPGIYVEPKDKGPASEGERQATYIAYMRRCEKHVLAHAVTNAAKRTRWVAAKVKREGLYTGWPDTEAHWNRGHGLIEFKNGTAMPDQDQISVLNRLHEMGHNVAVCRTMEGAVRWLRSVGAPLTAR